MVATKQALSKGEVDWAITLQVSLAISQLITTVYSEYSLSMERGSNSLEVEWC